MDAFKNFARATVSIGYNSAATSVVLTTGHGAKFPAVPFNAVWWDSTTYADPSLDPSVEIVRVTAISTDTLTVTRAQESTSASNKNTGGSTYSFTAPVTKLTMDLMMSSSGTAVVGNIPRATDTTGLVFAPSSAGVDTSGNLTVGSGTAAVPSLAWSADADGTGTGFYRSAANEIAISINGTLWAKITATAFDFSAGAQDFTVGASNQLIFSGRSLISSSADGALAFKTNGGTSRALLLASGGFNLGNTVGYGFASGSTPSTSSDTVLKRKGAGVLTVSTGNGSASDLGQISTINGVASGVVFNSTADATVANSTADTSIIGSGVGSLTIPASALNVAGKTLRVIVRGILSNTLTPTLNIKFKIGGTTIVSTGAQTVTNVVSNSSFEVVVFVTTRTTGSNGTVIANGSIEYDSTTFVDTREPMIQTSASTVNLTTTQAIDVSATWGTASASNTITGQIAVLEIISSV